ncbi:hypothetical protein H634G_11698 [Metarhizium anisopliae BRIP 53293]|uniref:Uncharacterized protein n=1 Tax=Metarhizium anisopliae BRIP 53293 TaxID=1291518 RepID=A0A0D9NHT0_METAN|nr:hypothetical protein H634G_11698 [Metarhizium anisopliae BRIP 53293]
MTRTIIVVYRTSRRDTTHLATERIRPRFGEPRLTVTRNGKQVFARTSSRKETHVKPPLDQMQSEADVGWAGLI